MSIKRRSFIGTMLAAPFMLSWLKPSKAEKFVAQSVDFDSTMYDERDKALVIDGLPNPEPIEGETVGEYAARKSAMMTPTQMDEMNVLHGCGERNRGYEFNIESIVLNNRLFIKYFKLTLDDIKDLTYDQRHKLLLKLPKRTQRKWRPECIRTRKRKLEPTTFKNVDGVSFVFPAKSIGHEECVQELDELGKLCTVSARPHKEKNT